jgi:hypothetical protein
MITPQNHRLANQVKHGSFSTTKRSTTSPSPHHNIGRASFLYFNNFKIVNFLKKEHMHTETIYFKYNYNTEEQFHCLIILKIHIKINISLYMNLQLYIHDSFKKFWDRSEYSDIQQVN